MIYELRPENHSIYMRVAAGSVQNLKPELVTEAFAAYCGIAEIHTSSTGDICKYRNGCGSGICDTGQSWNGDFIIHETENCNDRV